MGARAWILVTALLVLAVLARYSAVRGTPNPPNIIVILADDMGWTDVGPYDHDDDPSTPDVTNTPTIDRMGVEGVSMTRFYVSPVCSPSRAGLLTGRHPSRLGITGAFEGTDPQGMALSEITIAEALGAAGYRTAIVGKWHLGDQVQYLPTRQGFDSFYGPPYSNDIMPFYLLRDEVVVNSSPDQAMLTADYTSEAKQVITQAVSAGDPFFLFLSHSMPHVPVYASPTFSGSTGRGLYADAISELDWSVGEILSHLESLGIGSRTLVVFLSDNGPWQDSHGPEPWASDPWRWVGGSADPLRGSKATAYEGGVRTPFIARFPGAIPPGTQSDEISTIMDLFTTLVTLGGAQVPTDRVIDGQDLYPLLTDSGGLAPTAVYHYDVKAGRNQGVLSLEAMRSGRWKQHFAPGFVPTELYDLDSDDSETTPLDLPQTTALLRAQAVEHERTITDAPLRSRPRPASPGGSQ